MPTISNVKLYGQDWEDFQAIQEEFGLKEPQEVIKRLIREHKGRK